MQLTPVIAVPVWHRHWSDWVGFSANLMLAVSTFMLTPGVGLLLLPVCLHELLLACSFLMRKPLRRSVRGWAPACAAYSTTFIVMVMIQAMQHWRPEWLRPATNPSALACGLLLWLLGILLAISTLWHLRRAFSIEPQARVLITTGPYRIARHPVYAAYMLQYLGLWIAHPTLPLAAALLAWFGLMLWRVHYEEMVLTAAFPEYRRYQQSVGAFGVRFRAPSAENVERAGSRKKADVAA